MNEITTRTTQNEIATRTTQGYGIEGLEGMGPQDIVLPRYSIVQPTSKGTGDAAPGQFFNNLTKEAMPVLYTVILRINRSRTLWTGDLADKTPECSSNDGVTGRTYGACVECEFNRWGKAGEKYCRQGYVFLCAEPQSREKFLLSAMGTSVRPAKILVSQFVNKGRPPFSAVTQFSSTKVENEKGKFWVLTPSIYKWLEPGEAEVFRAEYQRMTAVNIHEVGETDDDTVGAADSGVGSDF